MESIHIKRYSLNTKPDGVKYILSGYVNQDIQVELVRSYWSGTLIVTSPKHVAFERVKTLYGDVI